MSIEVRTISPPDWERLQEAMAEQPIIAASLLSGRMPDNIEDTFRVAGLSMFPDRQGDLGDGLLVSRLVQSMQARLPPSICFWARSSTGTPS